jgi:hypothetical protein
VLKVASTGGGQVPGLAGIADCEQAIRELFVGLLDVKLRSALWADPNGLVQSNLSNGERCNVRTHH